MNGSEAKLLNEGMERLIDALGIVEAERFISLVTRERFDYTEWQREAFADMSLEDIRREALSYQRVADSPVISVSPTSDEDDCEYEEEAQARRERFYVMAA